YTLIKDEVGGHKVTAGTRTFDLASGGVEFKVCDDIAAKIPADVTAKLDDIKKGIVDGKIAITKAK
ncbi:BMP family ABC transporter substrate-binding protein, partial [Mesorhizobium sp. M8A.F.Ca.ET.059.01.1.1]